jgi:DNA-binding NtrC family response regulator
LKFDRGTRDLEEIETSPMKKLAIAIIEADAKVRDQLSRVLSAEGIEIIDPAVSRAGRSPIPLVGPDLVIVGSALDGARASLDAAREIRRTRVGTPIIFIARQSSEELAIAALRAGANDYFAHPVPCDQLIASVKRCLAEVTATAASRPHDSTDVDAGVGRPMIGGGAWALEIQAYMQRVATTDSNVLITGETGTGKELAAELIHRSSRRQSKPFVCINCAAIPDTLLESELFGYEKGAFTGAHMANPGKLKSADGGTVLFDEIGDMSPYAQAKILRVIESREIERLGGRGSFPVDLRVIAATNQNLERLMTEGRFRKDLYFRLNVVRIHLPALRERKEDLPALLDHYIREFSRICGREAAGITEEALAALLRYDWPGNIRELRNVIEAAFTTRSHGAVSLADLPAGFRNVPTGTSSVGPERERDRLLDALLATKWNKSKAAERLHWSRMTVYRKMAKYHLAETGTGPFA